MMDIDMLSDPLSSDPHPYFSVLRRDEPVHWSARHRAWFIMRFDDVFTLLTDPALSSDRIRPIFETRLSSEERTSREDTFTVLQDWMVFNDPPQHTRLRQLVSRAFTPRAVNALRPKIESIVAEVVDGIRGRQQIDLIADYAHPIPSAVIAEMIGVPVSDRSLFKDWSNDIATLVFGGAASKDKHQRGEEGLGELSGYLHRLLHRQRNDADTLLAMLAQAREADDALTEQEIISTCVLLLFAGHETTTNLIGNGIRALLQHEDQLMLLRRDPELISRAVEEILRYDGPSKMENRRVARDIEVRGQHLREGDQVFLVQSSANRDSDQFPDPDRLDLTRDPGRHVGFGFGIHHCLGAAVARLEGAIAIDALIREFSDLKLGAESETWHATLISRGMRTCPVSLKAS